jgi:ABC-2 type transport system permease protein
VSALEAFGILFAMQFASMRWFWRGMIINGFFVPMFILVFWKLLMGGVGASGSDVNSTAVQFLAGNMVVSLLFGLMTRVASRFAFLQDTGALDYYATLLVRRVTLILAVVGVFLIASLPGVLLALWLGAAWLAVPIHPHPLLALALALGAVSLAVLGAAIGVYSRSQEQSGNIASLATLGLTVLSPVLAPVDRLPKLLQWTSYLTPTTYATAAVRSALVSQLDTRFWINLAALVLFCLLALFFVARRLDWRA